MQGVGDRPAQQLAQSLSTDGIQLFFAGTRFNIIESAEEYQRIGGDLTAMILVQVVELAPRVREASNFYHFTLKERLVPRVVIAHQLARPTIEEGLSVFAAATVGKVVNHCGHRIKLGTAVAPKIRTVRATQTRLQHWHRRLICMQYAPGEQRRFQRQCQWFQPNTTGSHPLRQARSCECHSRAFKDAFQAVQRLMVGILRRGADYAAFLGSS